MSIFASILKSLRSHLIIILFYIYFQAPIDRDPYPLIHYAFDDSIVCPQQEDLNYTVVGSLDCLHVNFYVPHSATSQNLLPVMVWIYGGGFENGYSNRILYGPKFIVKHDVILVTFNYRVGPYGFMCLNTPEIPGNAGLKDQLAALRWIRQNIVAFGGDPYRITLFGESAGASSVEFHMVSGLVNGLFNKVILQSNSILSLRDSVRDDPILLASHLGFDTTDLEEAIEFLKREDPHRLIQATIELNSSFLPCIEEQFDGVESVIKDKPSTVLTTGPYYNVPVLSGFNNMESLYNLFSYKNDYSPSTTTDKIIQNFLTLYFEFNDEELATASSYVEQFYVGGSNKVIDNVYELINFESDIRFIYPIYRGSSIHLGRKNTVAFYEYIFSYSGDRNVLKNKFNITVDGASHFDEIGYLFDQKYVTTPISEDDQIIIDRITTMWTNFAKYK